MPRSSAERVATVLCPVIAVSLLLPFVLRQNAWFEWSNSLWLVERQADTIRDLGHPSYFLHTNATGAFYPEFLFYGGTLFAVAGGLAVALNSAWWAFVTFLVLATACAYGGVVWLGRQLGLGTGISSLAALVVATSPYTITSLYGRGAWTEVVAVGAIPLALAGALAVLRNERPWAGVAALVVASATVGASHNITALWGSLVCATLGVIAVVALGPTRVRLLSARRALLGIGAVALGAGLAAWSLVPAAAYSRHTRAYADAGQLIAGLPELDRLSVILRPYPFVPASIEASGPALRLQLPVYVLAWALAAFVWALAHRRGTGMERRLAAGLWLVIVALVSLLVAATPWQHAPDILATIQFPLRLHAYIVIVTALVVLLALRTLRGDARRGGWIGALVAALAVQTAFAQYSAWDAPDGVRRDQVSAETLPPAFAPYQRTMYRSTVALTVPYSTVVPIDAARIHTDRVALYLPRVPREPIGLNVIFSDLVRVRKPWTVAGHNDGYLVVRPPARADARALVIEPARPWPVALGVALSLASLGVCLAGGAAILVRRRRARASPPG